MTARRLLKLAAGALILVMATPILYALIVTTVASLLYRTNGEIASAGEKREYLLYVPKSYDRARPAPLVISLHGAMNWPEFQRNVSDWDTLADKNGFIVVYPAGTGVGGRNWSMEGWGNPPRMPDVRFISALIDRLQQGYNIDPARIYANGLSNGGGMAFVLSCTLPHRIAAIGAVAAAQSLPSKWCPDKTPVPMIAFHGMADRVVPYEGGSVWIAPQPFPNVRMWVADWARRNRCANAPVESAVARDVSRTRYPGCAGNSDVVLYTIRGGGHAWPGSKPLPAWIAIEMALFGLPVGSTSDSIDTTRVMWAFFQDHPLDASRMPPQEPSHPPG